MILAAAERIEDLARRFAHISVYRTLARHDERSRRARCQRSLCLMWIVLDLVPLDKERNSTIATGA